MALVQAASNEKKRVKVYELKNNDWFDRGTGFCTGRVIGVSLVEARAAFSSHADNTCRQVIRQKTGG